jgi:hypothetical protein
MSALVERVKHLLDAVPDPSKDHYATSLLLSEGGGLEFGCQTHWVGYTEEHPRREIREASIVHADRMLESWRELGEPGMVIENADDFLLYFSYGGNAVVEKGLAKSVIGDWLRPNTSVNVGEWGFASPTLLGDGAMQRAPSPKLRMRILKRDEYKCRVCGRSPKDHFDIELHVHHIRPWAAGGVTEDSNLMTLCHTCHNGLDPHFEFTLYRLLPQIPANARGAVYLERLRKYQEAAAAHA